MIEFTDHLPEGWTRGNEPYRTPDGDCEWNHTDLFFKGTRVADATTEWKQVKKNGKQISIYVMKITKYHTTDPVVIQYIDSVLADVEFTITDATYALELRREAQAKIDRAERIKQAAEDEAQKQAAVNKLFDGMALPDTRQRETAPKDLLGVAKHVKRWLAPIRYS